MTQWIMIIKVGGVIYACKEKTENTNFTIINNIYNNILLYVKSYDFS